MKRAPGRCPDVWAVSKEHEGFRAADEPSGFVAMQVGEGALWQLFPVAKVSGGWVTHVCLENGDVEDVLKLRRSAFQPYAPADDFADAIAVWAFCWRGHATHRELIATILHLRRPS